MSAFDAIDLAQLPAPDVVQTLEYEEELAAMKALAIAKAPELEAALGLESEPAVKILEIAAYYVLLIRGEVNDAARAVMLAHSQGADLENLAALFGVSRLIVDPGDPDALPPIPITYETDENLRRRAQLALEGLSVAGPIGAYLFHALSADGDVKDASVQSPNPGEVLVTVLSNTGDGADPGTLAATVLAALNDDDVRPLCDTVTTQGAAVIDYTIEATLYFFDGPDRAVVLATAQAAVEAYTAAQHKLGRDITLSGVYAALHQPGVQRVNLASPAEDIIVLPAEAAYCTAIDLTDGGVGE